MYLPRLWGFSTYIPVFPPATGLCSCSACGVSPPIYLYFLQQLGCVPAPPVRFLHLYTCISSSNWAVFLLRLWGFDGLAVRWPPTAGPERLQKLLILLNSRFNEEFRSSKRGMRGQLERLKIAVLMDMNRGDWLRIYDVRKFSSFFFFFFGTFVRPDLTLHCRRLIRSYGNRVLASSKILRRLSYLKGVLFVLTSFHETFFFRGGPFPNLLVVFSLYLSLFLFKLHFL